MEWGKERKKKGEEKGRVGGCGKGMEGERKRRKGGRRELRKKGRKCPNKNSLHASEHSFKKFKI